MKKILITGGCGFIGTNFIRYVLDRTDDIGVINLDKLTYAGNPANNTEIEEFHADRYEFVKGDICDEALVDGIFTENNISSVVNFAAESHVDRSIDDPNVFVRTNVLGTANLLNCARKNWKGDNGDKRFLQVSTDEVYGSLPEDRPELKFTESSGLDPHSPYSASKTSADLIVKSYYDTFGFPVLTTRCSNNYGPYQFPEKLIPLMINKALKDDRLPVYGDGLNVRDWLYVEDHCSAILQVLNKGVPGQVYNIGGNNEIRNIDIIKMILDNLNKPYDLIEYVKDRPGHDRRYAIDASKMEKELGWQPVYSFENKIKDTIEWYTRNRKWCEDIFSGKYREYQR